MDTVKQSSGINLQKTPYGRLIGIVEGRDQFRAVFEGLRRLGIRDIDIDVLDGVTGIESLEHDKQAVSHCFFGDMEKEMVRRYLTAVRSGHSLFAAAVEPRSVDVAAETAKALGATEIIHFGEWVITNY